MLNFKYTETVYMGVGSGMPWAPLDFYTWYRYTVVSKGLIVLFFGDSLDCVH